MQLPYQSFDFVDLLWSTIRLHRDRKSAGDLHYIPPHERLKKLE